MAFHLTGEPAADQVLDEYPFAVLVGMMLDQQYGMEHAFRGGWKVLDRFGTLDPGAIAAADPEQFTALCSQPPAIHRYSQSHGRATAGPRGPGRVRLRRRRLTAVDRGTPVATCSGGSSRYRDSDGRRPRSSSPCWPSSWTSGPKGGRRPRATTRWSVTGPSPTSSTSIHCRRCAPSSSRRRPRPRLRAEADGRAPSVTLPRPEAGRLAGPRFSPSTPAGRRLSPTCASGPTRRVWCSASE